jgi:hypothetical protein
MKIKSVIAGAAILALAGCGGTAAATHPAGVTPAPSHSQSRQQQASGDAARKLAQDDKARSAFEAHWRAIDFSNTTTIGAQLKEIAQFTATLNASPALKSAMFKLVGDTVAFYFGTKNVPTQEQIQSDANAVKNTV